MYDIVNEDRIDQELARIFRGVSKDARIARWLKKRGAAFLKSRVSDVIEVHPTSPGARKFPQWAMAKMAKDEPVFMFALGHGSLDQLTHVKDLFEALLDEEANQSPARQESAAKILNSLSHYDMVGAYELADEFFETMSRHNIQHAGRSRNAIFATGREDEEPVQIKTEDGLVWRQVVPRGLKTVGVVLKNCIGGRSYATSVKNGRSEVWCLVNETSDDDFDAQRDIKMVAQIDLKSSRIVEAKGPGNRLMPQYAMELQELAEAKDVEYSRATAGGVAVSTRGQFVADYRKLSQVGQYEVFVSNKASEAVHWARDSDVVETYSLVVGVELENGRLATNTVGTLWKNKLTGAEAVSLIEAQIFKTEGGVVYDKVAAVVEALKEVTTPGKLVCLEAGLLSKGREAVKSERRDLKIDRFGELFMSPDGEFRNFMDTFVYEDGDENVEFSVTEDGIVLVKDLALERIGASGHHILSGAPQIRAAAATCSAQSPLGRGAWRRRVTMAEREPTSLKAIGSSDGISQKAFKSLRGFDVSGEMTALTMQHRDPIAPVGFLMAHDQVADFIGDFLEHATPLENGLKVINAGQDGNAVFLETSTGGVAIAELRSSAKMEKLVDYSYGTFRDGSVVHDLSNVSAEVQRKHPEVFSVATLRDIDQLRAETGALPFRSAADTTDYFPINIVRNGKLLPSQLKNLGSEKTPIFRLDSPVRLVGVEPGPDGRMETGSIAWVAGKRPRGEITVHNVLPGGGAHLARALEEKTWRIADKKGRYVNRDLKAEGFRIANGALMEIAFADVDELSKDGFSVERLPAHLGDERQWYVHHENLHQIATVSAAGVEEPKIAGRTRAEVFFREDAPICDKSRDFIVDVINGASLALTERDMEMLGVEQFDDSTYLVVRDSSLQDCYNLSDTHYLGRIIPSTKDYPGMEPTGMVLKMCWSLVSKETGKMEAIMSDDGFRSESSTLDILRSAATLVDHLESGDVHLIEKYTAPEPAPVSCVS